jgi:hypothetical protein
MSESASITTLLIFITTFFMITLFRIELGRVDHAARFFEGNYVLSKFIPNSEVSGKSFVFRLILMKKIALTPGPLSIRRGGRG